MPSETVVPMKDRLARAERLLTSEDKPTYTQVMLIFLDLFYGFHETYGPVIEVVPDHSSRISRLEGVVSVGVGLTVILGIAAGLIYLASGAI